MKSDGPMMCLPATTTAVDGDLCSKLEHLRDRAEVRRDALRRLRPQAKQPPIIFNPTTLKLPSATSRLVGPPPAGKGDAARKASGMDGETDGSGTPESIIDFRPSKIEPIPAFAKSRRLSSSPSAAFPEALAAALEQLDTRREQPPKAEAEDASDDVFDDSPATPPDPAIVPPPDHVGRRQNSWNLEMMVQMMERQEGEKEEMDLIDILEAIDDDDDLEPASPFRRSVLPMLGTSHGKLPKIDETPPMAPRRP